MIESTTNGNEELSCHYPNDSNTTTSVENLQEIASEETRIHHNEEERIIIINHPDVTEQEEDGCSSSNRPDPPSIMDGCPERDQVPRGDSNIPTAVSTIETITNQSLLSEDDDEDDLSVSMTLKDDDDDDQQEKDGFIQIKENELLPKEDDNEPPTSPLTQTSRRSDQILDYETTTARLLDKIIQQAKPSRVARDPSMLLLPISIPSSPIITNGTNAMSPQAQRTENPVWDDQDDDGLIRNMGNVGLQHIRERSNNNHHHNNMIELLPAVEERIFLREPLRKQQSFDPARVLHPTNSNNNKNERRRIRLLLQEEMDKRKNESFIGHIRRRSSLFRSPADDDDNTQFQSRGTLTVSWYNGTSTLELNDHVRNSILRKLKLSSYMEIKDVRFLDETVNPPEEVVLSPFIPDGAEFTLQFALCDTRYDGDRSPEAPESPSAAPSPNPTRLLSNLKEKDLLRRRQGRSWDSFHETPKHVSTPLAATTEEDENLSRKSDKSFENELLPPQENADPVEMRLRHITELLLSDQRDRSHFFHGHRNEKRQVVFTLANYFVLFLSLLAISAEIQARAPAWLHNLEMQMKNVTDCASDNEALFRCVSNGEFAGLIASVIIWLTRNVATRRIFLFGFESPQKLWTVVYEALVTACSWGFSYLFVRRALNPDTRPRFLRKYWKDAIYGSLAGFNAFFLKQVLKNLLPQEAVEEMVFEPRLKILSWLPSFS